MIGARCRGGLQQRLVGPLPLRQAAFGGAMTIGTLQLFELLLDAQISRCRKWLNLMVPGSFTLSLLRINANSG
jgi:hypothetical protein